MDQFNLELLTLIKLLNKLERTRNIDLKYIYCYFKSHSGQSINWDQVDEIIGNTYKQNVTYTEIVKDCGFDSDCFEKYKNDENAYLNFLECPEVEEGMFECRKCKSKKIFTTSKQTRSGDESTTVFARCSNCKFGWIANN